MTSEESFARLRAIEAEEYPHHDRDKAEWAAFKDDPEMRREICHRYTAWRDDKTTRESEAIRALIPYVGLPCTVHYYTDRHAATVTRIISPNKVAVQDNVVKCIEYYSGNYEILPELQPGEQVFTKRSNGKWILEGQSSKDGLQLLLHYQSHYIDPHF